MGIKDLNYYEIHKIKEENLRKQYINKYYNYITYVHGPIVEELKNRGLIFNYSKSVNTLTLGEMMDELKLFCLNYGISKDEIKGIVCENVRKSKK